MADGTTVTERERFAGCLLGGAVGDALGAPVEFTKRSEILRTFGPNGITSYVSAYGGLGKITDDTQMTLFTAEGLLRAQVRLVLKGTTTYPGVVAHAYLRWLQTQGEQPLCDMDSGTGETGWLFAQQALHSRRAPDLTCISALKAMTSFGDPARNDSKGCGCIMRVAPVGLFGSRLSLSPRETFCLAADLAALTHGHRTGKLSAGVFAVLIKELAEGAGIDEALVKAKAILKSRRHNDETLRALEHAEVLAASDTPREAAIPNLGGGWIAEEAMAIAVYCAWVARDFRDGVVLAVNHDGDSDSTGSMVGNLLGAMYGVKAIPREWLDRLELRDVISELAEDLYGFREWEFDKNQDAIWRKYPGF